MDIDKQASFYLGKEYDAERGLGDPLLYDARDLTTHAVCIGMTGSGKTGLGTILLEEAAMDGVPAIVIDPKGDMTNLLLTFPELQPADFEPWINVDDARRKGQAIPQFAEGVAKQWREGLKEWGEGGERISKLHQAADFRIYTPGSDTGLPVSVLQTFSAPDLSWEEDEETLRETIGGTISGLLALLGIEADPVRSREHILLSTILENAWRAGQDLDLTGLIQAIQKPPIRKLGVMDLDVVYPPNDRFQLAMALNSVLASPSFQTWREGAPLDINGFLYGPSGKPQISVFYLAHLDDAERMFFITLLLERLLIWMRRQSGTTSLRALLYIDEMFGYLPPYPADPASKRPLLSLLKTARAFGLGLVLTTQNPVDLDYKGLTNAGSWFIGKLQTDRDKARVLEGMEGVISEAGTMLDRGHLDRLISSLRSRTFILHNVHEERPVLFQTRWAMSYLRGPLTREQVRQVMAPFKVTQPAATAKAAATAAPAQTQTTSTRRTAAPQQTPASTAMDEALANYGAVRPQVNGRVAQYVLPVALTEERAVRKLAENLGRTVRVEGARIVYEPYLLGMATLTYAHTKRSGIQRITHSVLLPLPEMNAVVPWGEYLAPKLSLDDLGTEPYGDALYGPIPSGLTETTSYTQRRREFEDYLYAEQPLPAWEHPGLKLYSNLDESEREFRTRVQEQVRQTRDKALSTATERLDREIKAAEEKLKREENELEQDLVDLRGRKQEEVLSAGESLVGLLMGRRRSSALSQASRRRRMTQKAKADADESEKAIEELKAEIAKLKEEKERALAELGEQWSDKAMEIVEEPIRPRRSETQVQAFGLAWLPQWLLVYQDRGNATTWTTIPAYPG